MVLFMPCGLQLNSLRLLENYSKVMETRSTAVSFRLPWMLLLFALIAGSGHGREVTVRLFANQGPERLTLIQGGTSTLVEAGANPVRRVAGPWRAQIPGREELKLPYPLEIRSQGGRLKLTIRVPLEAYVAAALAGESAGFKSDPSLAAMAVAARTYAVHFQDRHRAEGFDFCDTTHCQDLHFSAISERLLRAAEATEGELLWFRGSPAATYYGKDCGGSTEDAATVWPDQRAPYLIHHDDPYCPRKEWRSAIRQDELRAALLSSGIRLAGDDSLAILERTPSGRALRLRVGGSSIISASSLRFAAGRAHGWSSIPSDLYELRNEGASVIFEGRGSGHGVGLCQLGAARMGEQGQSYQQILAFYYPGTALGVTAQGFSWQSLGGERVRVTTTRPGEDRSLVPLADRLARAAEERSGLHWAETPNLRVFPTIATFRDATGEPGWVAASARGSVIRLQPPAVLRSRGVLDSTILHELLHALIESHARAGLPLWFREGAAQYLAANHGTKSGKAKTAPPEDAAFLRSPDEARKAYAEALDCFASLAGEFGEATVLSWIERGLPPAVTAGSARKP
jgi:stage II sporulation protein D